MSVMQGAKLAALGDGTTAEVCTEPGYWSKTHTPAAATQATITKAAGGAGYRHICKAISVSIAAAGTAQTPIQVVLRDGTSGSGAILRSWKLSAPANSCAWIDISDLSIVGSDNTAMTLEFTGAGVAASEQTVNFDGFTVNG